MSNTIEDYCDQIESNVDEIYRNSEEYSDEIIALADEFRDAASEIRDDAEAANEKYHELRDRYDEQNEEIQKCYQALEKMATVEEQHKKTRRWILGATGALLTAGGVGTLLTHGNDGGSTGGTAGSGDGTEFQSGESYSMGQPDDFDSLIEGDSEFYDWIETVDYKIDDLGAKTYLTETDGVGATVRELKSYDKDNDLAVLGEEVLGELEPDDLNQRRIE